MSSRAIVIGAGPAGLSAALGLLKRSYGPLILEQQTRWRDRVCGSFIGTEGVKHLRWLDLDREVIDDGAVPVPRCVITNSRGSEVTLELTQNGVLPLGLPRKNLESILQRAVQTRGGEIHFGRPVRLVHKTKSKWIVQSGPHTYESDWVVQAGGRFTDLPGSRPHRGGGWYGGNAFFDGVSQSPGEMSLHFFSRGYIGLLTFIHGHSNACGLAYRTPGEPKTMDSIFQQALSENQRLRKLMRSSVPQKKWQGLGPLPFHRFKQDLTGPFRVGDAAAVGDPFLGEGIGRALAAGPHLYASLRASNPNPLIHYTALWRRQYSRRITIGRGIRSWMKTPLLSPFFSLLLKNKQMLSILSRVVHAPSMTSE